MFHFFFFNDTATTEIYTLSLHDALPISPSGAGAAVAPRTATGLALAAAAAAGRGAVASASPDRKSTRLNSSHLVNSYAVFCLKKKKNNMSQTNSLASKRPRHLCYSRCRD